MNVTPVDWQTVRKLEHAGVPRDTLKQMTTMQMIDGALAFYEEMPDDIVLWHLPTGELSTMHGRAFALGEDNLSNAASFAFDCSLHICETPFNWLLDRGRGVVVLDWSRAFDRLRNAPRLAIAEPLLPTYRSAMKPKFMPELFVLTNDVRFAA
ncbi:MAG: hypothetical protein ABI697_11135 [Devosia sp.]